MPLVILLWCAGGGADGPTVTMKVVSTLHGPTISCPRSLRNVG